MASIREKLKVVIDQLSKLQEHGFALPQPIVELVNELHDLLMSPTRKMASVGELRFASEDEALLYLAQKTGCAVSVGRVVTASEAAKKSLVESAKALVRDDVLPKVRKALLEYLAVNGAPLAYERYIQPIESEIRDTDVRGIMNDVMTGFQRMGLVPDKEDKKEFIGPYFKWLAFVNGAYDNYMRRNLEQSALKTVERLKAAGHEVSPSHVEDALVQWFSARALTELPQWRKIEKASSFDEMLNRVFRDLDESDFKDIMQEVLVDNVGYEDITMTGRGRRPPSPERRQEVQRRLNLPEFRSEFKSISQSLRNLHKVMDLQVLGKSAVLKDADIKKIATWYKRTKLNRDPELKTMFDDFAKAVEEKQPRIAKNYDKVLSMSRPYWGV